MSGWLNGKLLRDARRAAGLSQGELAESAGVEQSAVSDWERGVRDPTLSQLMAMADELGRPYTEFVRRKEPVSPMQQLRAAMDRILEVPLLDMEAHAGDDSGQLILDSAYWSPPRVAGRNVVALRVSGACLEPDVQDGDILFVDRDATAEPGDYVVVTIDDSVRVFRYERRGRSRRFVNNDESMAASLELIEGVVVERNQNMRARGRRRG